MCHGHPRHHPCAHTSINWHYCPSALIDLETGYETPCSNISFAAAQPTTSDCPLQNCQFKSKGGSWTCCSCQQGPNTQGWCTMPMSRMTMNPESFSVESVETTCDHGCCSKCVQYGSGRDASPEMTFSEIRKGSASRKFGYSSATKSHRRGSAFSLPASGGESTPSPSTSESSSASSGYKHQSHHDEVRYLLLSPTSISAPLTQSRINFQAKPQPCPNQSTLRPEMRPSEGKLSALFVEKAPSEEPKATCERSIRFPSCTIYRSGPDEELRRDETRVDDDLQKSFLGFGLKHESTVW
ncbi:hypothetical protein DER46DRAFT_570339 [Fusarium sp. MPI-SDFR-AT-0072]|nr:hypothetical protein DER46DRAFT_570339 [Fusarium sp. MPI-SDFR-AT-0072]